MSRARVGYGLLGDDDGRFAYEMIATEFGASRFRSEGVAIATPPPQIVSVTPNSALVGGDLIDIDLSGFAPSTSITWSQCIVVNLPIGTDCAPPIGVGVTDDRGALSTPSHRLQRFIYYPERWVGCTEASSTCAIAGVDDTGTQSFARLDFASHPPPPVTVEGSGFRPDAPVDLHQCLGVPDHPRDCERPPCLGGTTPCAPQALASTTTDDTGSFSVEVPVAGSVHTTALWEGTESPVDCLAGPPGTCAIAAAEAADFPGTVASAPVARTVVVPTVLPSGTLYEFFWTSRAAEPLFDYAPTGGTVTFASGVTEQVVEIPVDGDLVLPDRRRRRQRFVPT